MNAKLRIFLALFPSMLAGATQKSVSAQGVAPSTTLVATDNGFELGGKPFQIIAGELHYSRIPRAYWKDRFAKARAMGLNTITTYAFWNVNEPKPGVWDFKSQNDIAAFIRDAGEAGLKVILRPGPYVCAEWDLGGYPSWLLKDRSMVLRSDDPNYIAQEKLWFQRLAQEVKPLLASNGGPIIAVQIENEYGSFGDDHTYLEGVRQSLIDSGLGNVLLYTSNPPSGIEKGSLAGVLTAVNFGTGDAAKSFTVLSRERPDGPKMAAEYWAGWFDKWGESHHETDGKKEAAELGWMLQHGYSVSIYLFQGGTNFGWMNGADSHTGADYHPDTTSYDYDAPLDESGRPRYKYELFREAIENATHSSLPVAPVDAPIRSFAISGVKQSASLWENLPVPVHATKPLSFEDLDQSFGYVLYRTRLHAGQGGLLVMNGVHSYAEVYINQKAVGSVDRRKEETTLQLPRVRHDSELDILVENTGRVNYSRAIRTERAGLPSLVTLDGEALHEWDHFPFPMDNVAKLKFSSEPCNGPCFYQAMMSTAVPADTFLDTRSLHKGQLWMGAFEQHNVGRFWTAAGPQYFLFLPGAWMNKGETAIWWFDLTGEAGARPTSVTKPLFGVVSSNREKQ